MIRKQNSSLRWLFNPWVNLRWQSPNCCLNFMINLSSSQAYQQGWYPTLQLLSALFHSETYLPTLQLEMTFTRTKKFLPSDGGSNLGQRQPFDVSTGELHTCFSLNFLHKKSFSQSNSNTNITSLLMFWRKKKRKFTLVEVQIGMTIRLCLDWELWSSVAKCRPMTTVQRMSGLLSSRGQSKSSVWGNPYRGKASTRSPLCIRGPSRLENDLLLHDGKNS